MGAYSDYVLTLTPYLYWRLGETAGTTGANSVIDASGNSRHGTPTSTTFGATGSLTGDADTAASFAAAGQIVNTAASIAAAYSISLRAKRNDISVSNRALVGWQNSYASLLITDAGNILLCQTDGSVLKTWASVWTDESAYHSILLTTSGVGAGQTATLYFDGVSQGASTTITVPSINQFKLAETINATGRNWSGSIDEAAVFASTLTSTHALTLHNLAVNPAIQRLINGGPVNFGPVNGGLVSA